MPVTNPLAIKFSNEDVRPHAENAVRLYYAAKSILDFWNTNGGSTVFPAGAGRVEDGAAADGRTPITSDDVLAFITSLNTFVTNMEASNKALLGTYIKPSVRVK